MSKLYMTMARAKQESRKVRHEMAPENILKDYWRCAEACVDYQVYVRQLPSFTENEWHDITSRLRDLGNCRDNAFGVSTVSGEWGFFQIPSRGFPELKLTFFQFVDLRQRQDVVAEIENVLQRKQ